MNNIQAQTVIVGSIQSRILNLRREADELEAALRVMISPLAEGAAAPGAAPGTPPADDKANGRGIAADLAAGKKVNGAAVAEVGPRPRS